MAAMPASVSECSRIASTPAGTSTVLRVRDSRSAIAASGDVAELPFQLTKDAIYVPIPWPELKERRAFGWFLRMSEDQILDSNLAVSHLFRAVL
jgi:hypothetical protein